MIPNFLLLSFIVVVSVSFRISPPREMEAEEKEKKEGKADSSETLDEHLPTDWPSVGIAPKLGYVVHVCRTLPPWLMAIL